MSSISIISIIIVGIGADAAWGLSRRRNDSWSQAVTLTGGDPATGRRLVRSYGCVGCHEIPGIPEATATVGPPLRKIAVRSYIAGVLGNSPHNMIRWLTNPPSVDPLTAMPVVGLSETDARHIAAFLYTLE